MTRKLQTILTIVPILACLGLAGWLCLLPKRERPIVAYSTGLRNRTRSQVHNLRLAFAAMDGAIIPPGGEFSFNHAVGPWTADKGYRRAPVSFSGERVLDWGGGVCQASTTLYNAALLAGLDILERHRHQWPANYVPPGQDAAVAFPDIDLKFRNTLEAPLRISARVVGESALVKLYCRSEAPKIGLEWEVLEVVRPMTVFRYSSDRARPATRRGHLGYDVVVYRKFLDGQPRRELISRDSYPARNRVVWR